MLLVAPVNSWGEAAPDRLFFFGNLIIWCHEIRWGLRRIPSTQIVGQRVRRSVLFRVRRFAPSSGFVSHGPTPSYLSGTNAALFTRFLRAHHVAAVRMQHLAADIRGFIAREEHIARSDLVGLPRTVHRHARADAPSGAAQQIGRAHV